MDGKFFSSAKNNQLFRGIAFRWWGRRLALIGSLCLSLFCFGCAAKHAPDPAPDKKAADKVEGMLNPPRMRSGDSWVFYRAAGEEEMRTVREEVVRVLPDGSYYLRVVPEQGREKVLEFSSTGRLKAYAREGQRYELPRAMLRLSYPLFQGKKWHDKFSARDCEGNIHQYKSNYTVAGRENIRTRAGSFSALHIVREVRREDGTVGREDFWFSPRAKRVVLSRTDWKPDSELLEMELNVPK
jgi:hypothetical protein